MVLSRLDFDRDAADDTVDELGELGLCQLKDLNQNQSPFHRHRTFSDNVRRSDDVLRDIRFLTDQIEENKHLHLAPSALATPGIGPTCRPGGLDDHLTSLEHSLVKMNGNAEAISTQHSETMELICVLEHAAEFFRSAARMQNARSMSDRQSRPLGAGKGSRIITGVIASTPPRFSSPARLA